MSSKKMMMMLALAFVTSFLGAYFAASWVAAAVTDHAAEQVRTRGYDAVVIVEC